MTQRLTTETYLMRFVETNRAVAAELSAEPVDPTLTRFTGTVFYDRAAAVHAVELWRGPLCLNAQNLDRVVHVSAGAELVIHIDLQHLPGQVDLSQFNPLPKPPAFTSVAEADAWLEGHR